MPATRYYSFDLTLGTNQVERLRKPPRDPAQLRVAHAGQWTDDNRKLDGSFERMEKFASEKERIVTFIRRNYTATGIHASGVIRFFQEHQMGAQPDFFRVIEE